jgi:hypothetical protein
MDRYASNTLRTLAIVAISFLVIVGSLVLLLLALCFGMVSNLGGSGHLNPQTVKLAVGALAAAAVLIFVGVLGVAKLAKGIVHDPAVPPLRRNLPEDSPSHSPGDIAVTSRNINAQAQAPAIPPPPAPTAPIPPILARPATVQPHSTIDVVAHLSPASRAAVRNLAIAIAVQIAAQIGVGIFSWQWAMHSPLAQLRFSLFTRLIWDLAAIAPYCVLLLSLLRRPGPRAFAYSLAIPLLQMFVGFFSHSAAIIYLLRAFHSSASFLSLVPWFVDILIFYLAWLAIRRTGIHPNPARIITASVVVFFYYSLLPMLLVAMNFMHR